MLCYRDCLLVRSATYVSTFGVLLCRADAALQLQGRCSGQLPWSGTCSSMQRNKKRKHPLRSESGGRTDEEADEEQELELRRRKAEEHEEEAEAREGEEDE